MSTLSIIIPCLNEAAVIQRLLASLQPARARGAELVVVDGDSHDETIQLAEPLVDLVLITVAGRARQMNAGAAASNGDVLWFLHADSVVDSTFPEVILSVMDAADVSWGRFDVALAGRSPLFRMIEFMMNWRSRLTGIVTGDQGMFIRRKLFEQAGGFPEIPLMEDIQLSTRLRKRCWPTALHYRIVTSTRRWEQSGILRTIVLMWRLRLAFFFGADPEQLAQRYR